MPKPATEAKPKDGNKSDETEKPSKSDCNSAIKILKKYERLAEKNWVQSCP